MNAALTGSDMLNHLMANILAWLYTMGFDSVSIHALFWICVIGVPLVIVLCATGHDGSKDKPRRKTR